MTRDLAILADKAVSVADQHLENEAARVQRTDASAELLNAAVAAVKPALRALSSRIVTARVMSRAGRTDKDAIGVPGIFVASPGVEQGPGPRLRSDGWFGQDLYLMQDGAWVLLVYDGVDSTAVSGVSEWSSDMVPLSAGDVVEMLPVDVVLDALSRALDKQLEGNRPRRTQEMLDRAARLRALATLVRTSL